MTPASPLRTPAARAAAVDRMPSNREWFAQAERLRDAEELRKALAANHVPYRIASLELAIRAHEQNDRIARVCAWAVERMRRADERFARGQITLGRVA